MRTFNPAAAPLDQADARARRWLHPLIFENLVAVDPAGGLHPRLAVEWDSDAGATRWRFRLRAGVKLHDGSPLDAGRVAASLRAPARRWTVTGDAGVVTIVVEQSLPDLPWQLAEGQYAVAFGRPEGGEPIGTGPFAIHRWERRRLTLRAHDEHWAGRPFVDTVQIEMGRPVADQMSSLELGRADIVSLLPQDLRRVSRRGVGVATTRPVELVAMVFAGHAAAAGSKEVRRALSFAIDRASICSVLLQRQGQPAPALLPEWLSGYAPLLARDHDRALARTMAAAVPQTLRTLTLGVDGSDRLLREIADRIAVDAREVGLSITVAASVPTPAQPDARLVRIRLEPTTRERALTLMMRALAPHLRVSTGVPLPAPDASLEQFYRFERSLMEQGLIVPLVHLPELYATASGVESWLQPVATAAGTWNLANVWLRVDR